MSCLREVQTISKSPDILPMPSLTRLTTGGVLNPTKNTTNTSHQPYLDTITYEPGNCPRTTLSYHTTTKAFNRLITTTHRHRRYSTSNLAREGIASRARSIYSESLSTPMER